MMTHSSTEPLLQCLYSVTPAQSPTYRAPPTVSIQWIVTPDRAPPTEPPAYNVYTVVSRPHTHTTYATCCTKTCVIGYTFTIGYKDINGRARIKTNDRNVTTHRDGDTPDTLQQQKHTHKRANGPTRSDVVSCTGNTLPPRDRITRPESACRYIRPSTWPSRSSSCRGPHRRRGR